MNLRIILIIFSVAIISESSFAKKEVPSSRVGRAGDIKEGHDSKIRTTTKADKSSRHTTREIIREPKKTSKRIIVEPAPQRRSKKYSINRKLSDGTRFHEFKIDRGNIEKIEVRWHDKIGSRNEARGRIFLNARNPHNMMNPTIPAVDYSPTTADIRKKGNTSTFFCTPNIYCHGSIVFEICEDDAWLYYFTVYYSGGSHSVIHPPDHSAPGHGHPLKIETYNINEKYDEDEVHAFNIRSGYVKKVEINWHDKLGRNNEAKGRLYLDRIIPENILYPVKPDRHYSIPTADIEKSRKTVSFVCHRPIYTRGRLLLHLLDDEARVYSIKVHYANPEYEPPIIIHERPQFENPNPHDHDHSHKEAPEKQKDIKKDVKTERY